MVEACTVATSKGIGHKLIMHGINRYRLLANNELTDYDPVAEAFKVYDPHETGFVDTEVCHRHPPSQAPRHLP